MSLCAICPEADLQAAQAALGVKFVPLWNGIRPGFGGLHLWGSQHAGLIAAIRDYFPSGQVDETEGKPSDRFAALVAANGGQWGENAPLLQGIVTPGLYYHEGTDALWWVIQGYDAGIWPDPTIIPSQVRRARVPGVALPWVAPLDQHDSYKLLVPFTGQPEEVEHDGAEWITRRNNNIWQPGTSDSGWLRLTPHPAPWVHVGSEGYPLLHPRTGEPMRATQDGVTYQNAAENNFWAPNTLVNWTVV
jgi:hypothetical protein